MLPPIKNESNLHTNRIEVLVYAKSDGSQETGADLWAQGQPGLHREF